MVLAAAAALATAGPARTVPRTLLNGVRFTDTDTDGCTVSAAVMTYTCNGGSSRRRTRGT